MEQSLEEQITQLLAHIVRERSEEHVTGTTTAETRTTTETHRPRRRVVNVYIDLQEDAPQTGEDAQETDKTRADAPLIESTLDAVDEMPQTAARSTPPIASPLPRQQQRTEKNRRLRLLPLVVLTVCLLVIGVGTTRSVLALVAPTATITIVPVSTTITTAATLPVVTRSANPTTAPSLTGRVLASITMNSPLRCLPADQIDLPPGIPPPPEP